MPNFPQDRHNTGDGRDWIVCWSRLPLPDGTVQTSVSSSVGFSPSPGGEARLFHEDQEPDGDRKPAAPGRHSLGYPAGLSVIESPFSMESLTPPTDQYAGSIVDFIAYNLLYSQQTG